jgi:hypothetical protein
LQPRRRSPYCGPFPPRQSRPSASMDSRCLFLPTRRQALHESANLSRNCDRYRIRRQRRGQQPYRAATSVGENVNGSPILTQLAAN